MTKIENFPFIRQIALDSFKLRLKVSDLNYFDPEISDHRLEIQAGTGDIIREFKTSAKVYEIDNIKMRLGYKHRDQSASPPEDCIYVLINSKQLGFDYFRGITWNTIGRIHKFLQQNNILKCSFTTFISGRVTDMDFKRDYLMEMDTYKSMLKTMFSLAKESKELNKGARRINEKMNQGIQFSKRESYAPKTAPFMKVYHKGLELMNTSKKGSNVFYNAHLNPMNVDDIIRVEVTVKNKYHFELFELKESSSPDSRLKTNILRDVLNLTFEEKEVIMSEIAKIHLEHTKNASKAKKPSESDDIKSGYDRFMYEVVKKMYEEGYSFTEIEEWILNTQGPEKFQTGNQNKARKRIKQMAKKIIGIYQAKEQPKRREEIELKMLTSEHEILSDLRLVS